MKNRQSLNFEYDPEVDAGYLLVAKGEVSHSEEVSPGLVVDLDTNNRVVGVEILNYSRRFGVPKTRRQAKPRKVSSTTR